MAYIIYILVFAQSLWAVPYEGTRMMAAGPSPAMIEAVNKVIDEGGNVADAAVAAALTLAVTSPYYASLGGGGFAMIKMGDKVEAIDFRETAPAATGPQHFVNKPASAATLGGAAVGVPGVPAGLAAIHKKYGKLAWKKLFAVPLKLAQEGFHVSGEWSRLTREQKTHFHASGGVKHFFKGDGSPYRAGEKLRQVPLAQALIELRNKGESGFYRGAIAHDIVKTVNGQGGNLSLEDLKSYKVRWLEPISTTFHGHKIFMMPPPSSSGVVMKTAFDLIEKTNLAKYKMLSIDELHLLGEILARSFRSRALLGDPDFHKNPISQIHSSQNLNELASSIKMDKSTPLPAAKEPPAESTETTHFSIVDQNGNAIAFTVTLNGSYGSRVVSERFGVALNNEMDDFTTRPGEANQFGLIQGSGNNVEPGKRPLSSMSPTLVERDGKIVLAVGAPGGPRIISAVIQTIYRHLVSGLDIDQAIQAPRIHHQFAPHKLFVDEKRFSPEILSGLQSRGHNVEASSWIGKAYAVKLSADGGLEAAFDARGEGAAGGL